jgi:VanZ family protein
MDVRQPEKTDGHPVSGRISARRHHLFVGYVILMLVAFLVPVPTSPVAETNQVDKLVHFGIFLGFALLFYGHKHARPWRVFRISSAFAGANELVQAFLPYRDGDWLDFVAGSAGAALGTLLVLWRERRRVRQYR